MTTVQAQPILAEQIVNAIISEIVDGNCQLIPGSSKTNRPAPMTFRRGPLGRPCSSFATRGWSARLRGVR
jgi:hypothetical protein